MTTAGAGPARRRVVVGGLDVDRRAHLEQFALPRLRTAPGVDALPAQLLMRHARGTGRDERRVA